MTKCVDDATYDLNDHSSSLHFFLVKNGPINPVISSRKEKNFSNPDIPPTVKYLTLSLAKRKGLVKAPKYVTVAQRSYTFK